MTGEFLLQAPWYRIPEEMYPRACREALTLGKEVAGQGMKLFGSAQELWVPDGTLYVNVGLKTAAPEIRRDWRLLGQKIFEDRRVQFFLDAYGRMYRKYRNEPHPPFYEEEIAPLLQDREEFLESIARQVEETQIQADQWHQQKNWRRRSGCEKVLEGLYGLLAEVGRDIRLLHAHQVVIREAPLILGEPIENFFRSRKEIKEVQEEALALVFAAVFSPRPKSICAACRQCLETGISPRDQRLRDMVLPFHEWIEADDRLQDLAKSIAEEIDRREASLFSRDRQHPQSKPRPVDGDIEDLLQEVLPVTRGKMAVMIGGVCKPMARDAIADVLQLRGLEWPTLHENRQYEIDEARIAKADIIYLNKFNRKASKRLYRVCKERNRPLVQLGTYGLNHVIYRSWDRFCNRQSGFAALSQ